jgi:hypothetical protein
VLQEAQRLICRKLGLPADADEEAEQLRKRFESSFDTSLSPAQIDALTVLAGSATMGSNKVNVVEV